MLRLDYICVCRMCARAPCIRINICQMLYYSTEHSRFGPIGIIHEKQDCLSTTGSEIVTNATPNPSTPNDSRASRKYRLARKAATATQKISIART